MRRIILFGFLIFFIISVPASALEEGCSERIVSVTLASDEILVDILSDKARIAGLTYLSDDRSISNIADRTEGIPKIRANLEQIVELNPDLVITAGYLGSDFIKLLKTAGLNVMVLEDVNNIDSIEKNIISIGERVCEQGKAEKLVKKMTEEIKDIKNSHNHEHRPSVMFYSAPGFTAGPNSLIDEIISIAGGRNAFQGDSFVRSSKISLEYIIKTDPDVIILSSFTPTDPGFEERFLENPAVKQTRAFKDHNIYVIQGRYIISSSHYIVKGIKKLEHLINGGS